MSRRTISAAAALAAVLLVAGCASDGKDDKTNDRPKDPKAAVLTAARTYMEAANADDWKTACGLTSERRRYGTVEYCIANHDDSSTEPSPSASGSASASAEPSASGAASASASPRPERADMGPVEASAAVEVAAVGKHPAGYGVLVTYTYTWPGKSPETSRLALRLVNEGGTWVVDQRESVRPKDMAAEPDPLSLVRSVLTAGG
ncbi:hypothetical protein ACFY0G_40385 [Streptomyces sp. NPDC001552]|uniref:hypothetical protein n=1 Tax=Streptomyces sp. NPDC001552 TaxID=3364587 RepID=UPI0036A812FC